MNLSDIRQRSDEAWVVLNRAHGDHPAYGPMLRAVAAYMDALLQLVPTEALFPAVEYKLMDETIPGPVPPVVAEETGNELMSTADNKPKGKKRA